MEANPEQWKRGGTHGARLDPVTVTVEDTAGALLWHSEVRMERVCVCACELLCLLPPHAMGALTKRCVCGDSHWLAAASTAEQCSCPRATTPIPDPSLSVTPEPCSACKSFLQVLGCAPPPFYKVLCCADPAKLAPVHPMQSSLQSSALTVQRGWMAGEKGAVLLLLQKRGVHPEQ